MTVLVNGVAASAIDVRDRGLAYGDGLFETIRVVDGAPILLPEHLQRLRDGCVRLGISVSVVDSVRSDVDGVLPHLLDDHVVKVIVTRGMAERGYAPAGETEPTRIMMARPYHPHVDRAMSGISMMVCNTRLSKNAALAGIKHLNRLEQVLGAAELPDDCVEGLMLDTADEVVECTRSNVFAVCDNQMVTPSLALSGVDGVLRRVIMAWTGAIEVRFSMAEISKATELFVCNSVFGIYPVHRIACSPAVDFTIGAITRQLQARVHEECGLPCG